MRKGDQRGVVNFSKFNHEVLIGNSYFFLGSPKTDSIFKNAGKNHIRIKCRSERFLRVYSMSCAAALKKMRALSIIPECSFLRGVVIASSLPYMRS